MHPLFSDLIDSSIIFIFEIPWTRHLSFASRNEKNPIRRFHSFCVHGNLLSVRYKRGLFLWFRTKVKNPIEMRRMHSKSARQFRNPAVPPDSSRACILHQLPSRRYSPVGVTRFFHRAARTNSTADVRPRSDPGAHVQCLSVYVHELGFYIAD